ncbi:MAG: transporter substrate-binding domain-containing protein [Thermoanaerobaculales bacterium]|jgi:membrane-bound lytic murein transglycosylase F|nr:transporter substrate-binding domain-containing protein [Thermoanaerobaculales bacterium]
MATLAQVFHELSATADDASASVAQPRRTGRVALLATAALVLVLAVGCAERDVGDLPAIRERGELRVAVRPGFRSAPAGREVLVEQLAARLGVGVRWVEPAGHDQLVEWLEKGRADLVVSRHSPVSLIGTSAVASTPVEWVDEVVIVSGSMPDLDLADLRGGAVHLPLSALTPALEAGLAERGLSIVAAPEEMPLEVLVAEVAAGRVPAAVVDSGVLEASTEVDAVQTVGPPLLRRPVVWSVRGANGQLRRAVDDFLFAEEVLARSTPIAACLDLGGIRRARVLRVVTRNSPTTCFVSRGGLEGFEYELAVAFARELRLRLELAIPPPGVDPVEWLEQGFGDLAVLHEPAPPSVERRFLVSRPYREVDLVSVVAGRANAAFSVDDLAGTAVAASPGVAEMVGLIPLEPQIGRVPAEGDLEAFGALQLVARGAAAVAVVDSDAARLGVEGDGGLQIGPVVVPGAGLVWLVNASSSELAAAVDGFLDRASSSGLIAQLAAKNLGRWLPEVSPRRPVVPDGDLTPYDEYLTWAARRNGIDWRLLASLMYEESRFDPDAVGPGGSAGLFQLMPSTWLELGVEDPHHPGEAIEAGARYLRWLIDQFPGLDLADQVAMAIASYNVGPRHVADARRLAVRMGLDPDRWAGNVETAMYLLDDPEVARDFPAGACQCRRGAAYTRRILRRYAAYAEQFPPA